MIVGGAVLAVSAWRSLGGGGFAEAAARRTFICSATGKPFTHELAKGDTIPVASPHSGKPTGYPAELCYWTADGRTKDEPTPVLLNTHAGLPGATFCPDCGRLVVGHNPKPAPGDRPPPTKAQMPARAGGARERRY